MSAADLVEAVVAATNGQVGELKARLRAQVARAFLTSSAAPPAPSPVRSLADAVAVEALLRHGDGDDDGGLASSLAFTVDVLAAEAPTAAADAECVLTQLRHALMVELGLTDTASAGSVAQLLVRFVERAGLTASDDAGRDGTGSDRPPTSSGARAGGTARSTGAAATTRRGAGASALVTASSLALDGAAPTSTGAAVLALRRLEADFDDRLEAEVAARWATLRHAEEARVRREERARYDTQLTQLRHEYEERIAAQRREYAEGVQAATAELRRRQDEVDRDGMTLRARLLSDMDTLATRRGILEQSSATAEKRLAAERAESEATHRLLMARVSEAEERAAHAETLARSTLERWKAEYMLALDARERRVAGTEERLAAEARTLEAERRSHHTAISEYPLLQRRLEEAGKEAAVATTRLLQAQEMLAAAESRLRIVEGSATAKAEALGAAERQVAVLTQRLTAAGAVAADKDVAHAAEKRDWLQTVKLLRGTLEKRAKQWAAQAAAFTAAEAGWQCIVEEAVAAERAEAADAMARMQAEMRRTEKAAEAAAAREEEARRDGETAVAAAEALRGELAALRRSHSAISSIIAYAHPPPASASMPPSLPASFGASAASVTAAASTLMAGPTGSAALTQLARSGVIAPGAGALAATMAAARRRSQRSAVVAALEGGSPPTAARGHAAELSAGGGHTVVVGDVRHPAVSPTATLATTSAALAAAAAAYRAAGGTAVASATVAPQAAPSLASLADASAIASSAAASRDGGSHASTAAAAGPQRLAGAASSTHGQAGLAAPPLASPSPRGTLGLGGDGASIVHGGSGLATPHSPTITHGTWSALPSTAPPSAAASPNERPAQGAAISATAFAGGSAQLPRTGSASSGRLLPAQPLSGRHAHGSGGGGVADSLVGSGGVVRVDSWRSGVSQPSGWATDTYGEAPAAGTGPQTSLHGGATFDVAYTAAGAADGGVAPHAAALVGGGGDSDALLVTSAATGFAAGGGGSGADDLAYTVESASPGADAPRNRGAVSRPWSAGAVSLGGLSVGDGGGGGGDGEARGDATADGAGVSTGGADVSRDEWF